MKVENAHYVKQERRHEVKMGKEGLVHGGKT